MPYEHKPAWDPEAGLTKDPWVYAITLAYLGVLATIGWLVFG